MSHYVLASLADEELVALSRRNMSAAYAELWLRHSSAALAVARAFTTLDADDVVSEAFTRVFARIKSGGGPTMGFRAYLLTAVKNVAREWGARVGDTCSTHVADLAADTDTARAAESALESGATVAAFRSLPTRWQEALWYSEVEGLKPRQFAPLLGLAANAASALVVRARRGFRDAWVSAQLRAADNDECRSVLSLLGAHTRGALSARDARAADEHLATCERCALAWREAKHLSSRLALALLPVVVGSSAVGAYTAWLQPAGAAVAAVVPGTRPRAPLSGLAQIGTVAAGVVAVVAITAGVWAATGSALNASGPGTSATAVPDLAHPSSATPRVDGDGVSVADPAPPVPEPQPGPPSPPRREISPAPPTVVAPDAPEAVASPSPVGPTPTPPSTTTTSRSGVRHHPSPAPLSAPDIVADADAGTQVYPLVSDTDSEPDITVDVADERDAGRASPSAEATDIPSASDLSSESCATAASAGLPATDQVDSAPEALGERPIPLSDATVAVGGVDVIPAPDESESDSPSGLRISIAGEPWAFVQFISLSGSSPCRTTPMMMDAAEELSAQVTLISDETLVIIGIRHIEPGTGPLEPTSFETLTSE